MSLQEAVRELKKISNQLKRTDSYFDRDQHSLGSVVTLPTATLLSGALEEYTQYVITTDGDIGTITYQVKSKRASSFGPEIEAKDLAYIPGPVQDIKFGNDTAQAGKNINLIKYNISRLAPPMVPPSPPGTRSELVDPHIQPGYAGLAGIQVPFEVTLLRGAGRPFILQALITTTNTDDSFESPINTSYVVTTGKLMIMFGAVARSTAVAKGLGFLYGDDESNDDAAPPTNAVNQTRANAWELPSANINHVLDGVYIETPAGKFPHLTAESTSGTLTVVGLAIEVDTP